MFWAQGARKLVAPQGFIPDLETHMTEPPSDELTVDGRWALLVVGGAESAAAPLAQTLQMLGAKALGHDGAAGNAPPLTEIHQRFLTTIGWDRNDPRPPATLDQHSAQAVQDELIGILDRQLTEATHFVVTDPHLGVLLPLWLGILESFGAIPVIIVPVQRPQATNPARWLRDMLAAERASRQCRRLFVHYDAFIAAPGQATRDLARCLGWRASQEIESSLPAIQALWTVEQENYTPTDVKDTLPVLVQRAYRVLSQAVADEKWETAALDDIARRVDEAAELYAPRSPSPHFAPLNKGNDSVLADLERVRQERDALVDARADLRCEMDRMMATVTTHQASIVSRLNRAESAFGILARLLTSPYGVLPVRLRLGGLIKAVMRGRLRHRLAEDRAIAQIARSGRFDATYYLRRYTDVAASGIDPIVHYVRSGAREGRNPHPGFNTRFYCNTYPDVVQAGINPLAHYILCGISEGRRPNPTATMSTSTPTGLDALLATSLFGGAQPAGVAPPVAKR